MKFSFSNLLAIASICVWATAWAATEKKADAETGASKAATAANTKMYTEVSFPKGSDALSAEESARINNLVSAAGNVGKISEVRVITWGDVPYPAAKGQKAPDAQRDLANARNKTIENALANKNVSVKTYNMAEQPGALSELLNTSDAKVKKTFAQAGLTGHPNKISKSEIVVIMAE